MQCKCSCVYFHAGELFFKKSETMRTPMILVEDRLRTRTFGTAGNGMIRINDEHWSAIMKHK